MRGMLAAIVLLLCAQSAPCDDVAPPVAEGDPTAVVWEQAFSPISAADTESTLVMILISNDDPLGSEPPAREKPELEGGDRLWCSDVLLISFRKMLSRRPDLTGHLSLQSIAAGLPAGLTGGVLRNQPARAVVALCDGKYRLLAFAVGVPDTSGLLTLVEDAEEVRQFGRKHQHAAHEMVASIAQRSSQRLDRMWRSALQEMFDSLGGAGDEIDRSGGLLGSLKEQQDRLAMLNQTYQPTYMADAKLRFGLSELVDRQRLVILEQHPQARQPWCESMIPFIADNDFVTLWKPLCESLWGVAPIVREFEAADLLEWWDAKIKTGSVVLSLLPPLYLRGQRWPPVEINGKKIKRGSGWARAQELAMQLPYRSISLQQLSTLIQSRDLQPIDIQQPAAARYLLFESAQKPALVIRQGDPPGRFIGKLQRAK